MNIKIIQYANANVARFDTHLISTDADNGTRVSHYVFRNPTGIGYIHEIRYLSRIAAPGLTDMEDVSERQFWGKVRLVVKSDGLLPETWGWQWRIQ